MIAVGAAVGAPARYVTDRALQARHDTVFPWGTLAVNVVASLVLGVVTGLSGHVSADVAALLATGFCGALSTFSTFSYETIQLAQERASYHAGLNVALSLILGLGAGALGWAVGGALG
jgi:CrcB protein